MRANAKAIAAGTLFFAASSLQTVTTALAKTDKITFTIPSITGAPALENFLQMKPRGHVEEQMLKIEGFIQQEPKDGEPASQRTEVYVAHDENNVYAVFLAFDNEPDKVRAHVNRRENVFNDDIVEIMIDTFQDEQRAFAFVANPLGVQWDALWTEGPGFDESFDTLWHSDGRLTDQGYVVSMTIPFKSLRFPSTADQSWGVVFVREIRRGSFERSFWPRVSSRIEGRLNQAATLHIEESISPSRNIQLIPYGTYRTFRLLDQNHESGPGFASDAADPAGGLDAKWVFKDNMALDLTANPDFSQVESDRPQVTVNQRFEVFFPEKRPFFLENANFFNTLSNLVFTRRIADPQFGLRLTGKAGPYALGAILIDDQAPGRRVAEDDPLHGKRAGFGVLRVSRDILSQSRVGLIYADREFKGSYNRVGGVDGRIKFNQNWTSSFLGVMSATKTQGGERFSDPAFNVSVNRNGRQLNSHFHYIDIHPNFNTETGFVPRTDTREFHTFHSYRFRPERSFLISWGPNFFVQQIRDHDNLRLDQSIGPDLVLDFTGQTQLIIGYQKIRERLRPRDFAALTRNVDFERDLFVATFKTSFIDQLSFDSRLEFGTGINFLPTSGTAPFLADRRTGDVELSLLPSSKFRVDNNYIFSELDERHSGTRIFKNHILRTRLNWQHNRRFSLRLILQYNVTLANQALTSLQTTKNFNVDFLVTYLVNPWTALYVGLNSNYQNLDLISSGDTRVLNRTRNSFLNDSRQLFVKYSYLLRI
jgi:hypothetical protein